MATDILVPTLGESVTEATIAQWLKKPGEAVAVDEPLVELETDKVTLEVNASAAGVLAEVLAQEGDNVEVGALLGRIAEGGVNYMYDKFTTGSIGEDADRDAFNEAGLNRLGWYSMMTYRYEKAVTMYETSIERYPNGANIWMAYYNLSRTHRGISGKTPAMALGLTSEPWPLERLIPHSYTSASAWGDQINGLQQGTGGHAEAHEEDHEDRGGAGYGGRHRKQLWRGVSPMHRDLCVQKVQYSASTREAGWN